VADQLKAVLVARNLISRIGNREHVNVEGWTLCGTMLGVFPICEWTRPVNDGWEARVEVRTLAGQLVGAAEAQCLRAEKEWGSNPTRGKPKDDYALRSMAQTRATSKALRQPLGFIVQMAGFNPTPAEEMPLEDERKEGGLGEAPVPKSWAKVREWHEKHGNWELAELFVKACSYHLYGQTESKALTPDQRKVVLQKAAGAVVWLAENGTNAVGPLPPSVPLYTRAWASVMDGVFLEVPEWQPRSMDSEADAIADEVFDAPA
jgi:hypothetical protein